MRMIPRLLRVLAPSAALLVLVGCGSEGAPDRVADEPSAGTSDPSTPPVPADVVIGCGGDMFWSASAMNEPVPGMEGTPVHRALEAFAADKGPDLPPLFRDGTVDDGDWFTLAEDGHAASVGTGPWTATGPGEGAQVIDLDNDGGWEVTSWGDCSRLQPFLDDGAQWVQIDGVDGTRETERPTLLISEIDCTSGRDPRPHLRTPAVVETADSVTVTWTSDAIKGSANCVGTMPVPAELTLEAPLGDRVLYDGSVWPPRKVD